MDSVSVEYFILKKNVTFWNEGTFTLASSVQEVPAILNEMTCRVSASLGWFIDVLILYKRILLSKLA